MLDKAFGTDAGNRRRVSTDMVILHYYGLVLRKAPKRDTDGHKSCEYESDIFWHTLESTQWYLGPIRIILSAF